MILQKGVIIEGALRRAPLDSYHLESLEVLTTPPTQPTIRTENQQGTSQTLIVSIWRGVY